jgi:pimeloyl-ACP methyl ester carboxylesterase
MTPEQWQAGGDWLNLPEGRLFVRAEGTGEALLLIHGFPTSSWDWAALWPKLRERYFVIAFDLLGFGRSDKPRLGDYRIHRQADRAEAVLRHFGVTGYAVLAHDLGDTVVQELIARRADGRAAPSLRAAVLLNGGLFPETHRPLLLQRLLLSPLGPLVARCSAYPRFARSLRRICVRPWPEAELREHWRLLELGGGRRILHRLLGYMRERRQHRERWVGALQRRPIPIRLIDGSADPISGAHMVRRYRELVADADAVELAEVGHYPQIEAPDAVLAAALSFLERVRQEAQAR